MPKGERTPPNVVAFIIDLDLNAPNLKHPQIKDRVFTELGFQIEKSTVGKILRRELRDL